MSFQSLWKWETNCWTNFRTRKQKLNEVTSACTVHRICIKKLDFWDIAATVKKFIFTALPLPYWLPVHQPVSKFLFQFFSSSLLSSVSGRETIEGWPLLTVETEANGDSKRTNERNLFLVGSSSKLGRQPCWVACLLVCVSGLRSPCLI